MRVSSSKGLIARTGTIFGLLASSGCLDAVSADVVHLGTLFPPEPPVAGQIVEQVAITAAADSVYSLDLELAYNPPATPVLQIQLGSLASQMVLATNSPEPGIIRVGLAGANPIGGEGTILAVTFQGSAGVTLSISQALVNEGSVPFVVTTNTPPALRAISDQSILALQQFTVTNTATDLDLPTNALTFEIVSAPAGVNLDSRTGVLIWTPNAAQAPSTNIITLKVSDNGVPPLSATNSFMVIVNSGPPPTIKTESRLPSFPVGSSVNLAFAATGGIAPYQWSITSGTLPRGLALDSAGGLSGTPTEAGAFSFTIKVAGADGAANIKAFTLQISPAVLTVTGITAGDKLYDGTTAATLIVTNIILNGILAFDTGNVTLVVSSASGAFSDKNANSNKLVTISGISLKGSAAGNYTVTQPVTSAAIAPATVTVTQILALNKPYDGTVVAAISGPPVLSGVIAGDSLSLAGTLVGAFSDPNIGTNKTVTLSGISLGGADAANYVLSLPVLTASITEALSNTIHLTGKVTYYNTGAAVPGAALSLTGDSTQSATTAADGSYSFTVNAGGNYSVVPQVPNDAAPSQGITTLDIALIRRHILSIAPLDSPYKLIAADVNGSKSITTLDIALIRRVILAITNSFPGGSLWRFVSASEILPQDMSPWEFATNLSYTGVAADQSGQDFVAVQLGDVNSSWTPAGGLAALGTGNQTERGSFKLAAKNGAGAKVRVESAGALPGGIVSLPVRVSGFKDATSLQFTLGWDPTKLEFIGLSDYGLVGISERNFGIRFAAAGKVSFSWDDPEGQARTVEDGVQLFSVRFRAIGAEGSAAMVDVSDIPTPRELSRNFAASPLRAESGVVGIGWRARILGIAPGGSWGSAGAGAFEVTFLTAAGVNYTLEAARSVTSPDWIKLERVAGNGRIMTVKDERLSGAARFYRIKSD